MRFALLIYSAEADTANMSESEQQVNFNRWFKYSEDIRSSGKMLGGEALMPTATATTVRTEDGEPVMTDGPFAETKEQLGGFYLIEADNLDEASEWAARMPVQGRGSVEIRPLMEFDQP